MQYTYTSPSHRFTICVHVIIRMCTCDHMCYCIITNSVAINLHALYLLLYSLFREKTCTNCMQVSILIKLHTKAVQLATILSNNHNISMMK